MALFRKKLTNVILTLEQAKISEKGKYMKHCQFPLNCNLGGEIVFPTQKYLLLLIRKYCDLIISKLLNFFLKTLLNEKKISGKLSICPNKSSQAASRTNRGRLELIINESCSDSSLCSWKLTQTTSQSWPRFRVSQAVAQRNRLKTLSKERSNCRRSRNDFRRTPYNSKI